MGVHVRPEGEEPKERPKGAGDEHAEERALNSLGPEVLAVSPTDATPRTNPTNKPVYGVRL